jgi:hypothetical protein
MYCSCITDFSKIQKFVVFQYIRNEKKVKVLKNYIYDKSQNMDYLGTFILKKWSVAIS